MITIKNKLETHLDQIKHKVAEKLSSFLPDWSPSQAKIIFTINEQADFCINNNTITVDLGRLLFEKQPLEKVVGGLTHEIFHLWMAETNKWRAKPPDSTSKK